MRILSACRRRMQLLLCVVLCVFASLAAGEDKVLVLVDSLETEQTHSAFFAHLQQDLGFRVRFMLANSNSLNIMKYDQSKYDHLILFAPKAKEFGGSLKASDIIDFVDQGRNVLIVAGDKSGNLVRDVSTAVGFEIDSSSTAVIDYVSNHGSATLVKATNVINAPVIVGKSSGKPILFRGVGLSVDTTNTLTLPILAGNPTTYSHDPTKAVDDTPHAIGTNTILVGGLQARNNARVVISGSLDLFSNEFFLNQEAGNGVFAAALADWTFKVNGVVEISNLTHHKTGETSAPRDYTVGDTVHFSVDAKERVNGKWVPFSGKDVQLEFVRIDPFVRKTLENDNGKLKAVFKAPDVYGVFKFKIDHKRVGFTFIESETQVVVTPLLHNQYERFLPSAYPYYAGAFSMMFGLFIFSFVFLYHK
eukprot:m.34807 g.34807  ORF g.34807 m.34807 type:complete len:419 (-) comp43715_c0_seq1:44-1300(-)